jgi:hypothetical protein
MLACNHTDYSIKITNNTPANFELSNLTISPVETEYLDVVTIYVTISNNGGSTGSYDVVLYINGLEEGTKCVTMAPGTSEIVTFYVNRISFGIYEVSIDKLTGTFEIIEPWPFGE